MVDPGPADPAHLDAVLRAAGGEIEGIVLTHSHADHAEGAEPLAGRAGVGGGPARGRRAGGPVRGARDARPFGRQRLPAAGHGLLHRRHGAGRGQRLHPPGEGSLAAYLDSLRALRELDLEVLCPGHGPYVRDPRAKLDEYIAHRLERERMLLEALEAGARTEDELLDRAWADAPAHLRGAAALTLRAHMEKLEAEGRVPSSQ